MHIGLNAVTAAAYEGWDGSLSVCAFDANDMAAIAKSKGMKSTVILTWKATDRKFNRMKPSRVRCCEVMCLNAEIGID